LICTVSAIADCIDSKMPTDSLKRNFDVSFKSSFSLPERNRKAELNESRVSCPNGFYWPRYARCAHLTASKEIVRR
jgi:hypothetical protein